MGLLDNTTHQLYYQGNDLGNYQFVSLEDIINQFMTVYVGEQKIISKASRIDVAFHAQRALAELSFDTFKSVKAQEIVVPATLQMILPHDYVNYTKISWSDAAGIKHPLYPTNSTSNPFDIEQDSDGNYTFPTSMSVGVNVDFEGDITEGWQKHTGVEHIIGSGGTSTTVNDEISITGADNALTFKQFVHQMHAHNQSCLYCVWQPLDVSTMATITLSAIGTTQGAVTNIIGGTLTIGISSMAPTADVLSYTNSTVTSENVYSFDATSPTNTLLNTYAGDPAQLEWTPGETSEEKKLVDADEIDVSNHSTVYLVITSEADFTTNSSSDATDPTFFSTFYSTNSIDDIIITSPTSSQPLSTNSTQTSSTWDSYKSGTPSENQNQYDDDSYWPMDGSRFGLDPSHAQANGSFFINDRLGKIHFSSNISGKTVILDYISDSLGTEGEMQVHKFAEDAMYKWINHAILSGSSYGQGLVPRLTKEKFAAIRKAKLRLSNIKLEELTQILRGKSKQIKH